jgi:hypothetical protein
MLKDKSLDSGHAARTCWSLDCCQYYLEILLWTIWTFSQNFLEISGIDSLDMQPQLSGNFWFELNRHFPDVGGENSILS